MRKSELSQEYQAAVRLGIISQAEAEAQTMWPGGRPPVRITAPPADANGQWPFQTLGEIRALDLPTRAPIIGPISSAAVTILAATRGTGKTLLATEVAQAVASGEAFCDWEVHQPGPVAFVQLDMAVHAVQSRADGREWHPDFHYVTRWHFQQAGMAVPDLGDESHHDAICAALAPYSLIIFDTRRACQPPGQGQAGNLWHPSYWIASAPLRYRLVDQGKAVMLLDHLTAEGEVKDTKAIEDDADCIIALKDSDKGTQELCFQIELTKDRDNIGGFCFCEFDGKSWRMWTEESRQREVWEYRQDHTIKETAEEFSISEGTVKNWCRQVRHQIRETNLGFNYEQ